MSKYISFLCGIALALVSSVEASGIGQINTIAQAPLETMVSAQPNVMLFIDNSLSMSAISTHKDYRYSTQYPEWTVKSDLIGDNSSVETIDGDHIDISGLSEGNCMAGFIEGIKNQQIRCLKLPSTKSGRWLYSKRYLDFLFEYFPSGSDLSGSDHTTSIPRHSRLDLLKIAAIQLAKHDGHARLCLASFAETNNTIEILLPCSDNLPALLTGIEQISLRVSSSTPLAEAYYQLTRYFRGIPVNSLLPENPADQLPSPVEYRCQGSAIVMFTDGVAIKDQGQFSMGLESRFSHNLKGNQILPDWDGVHPETTEEHVKNSAIPHFSDGTGQVGTGFSEGRELYIDDLTKFGFDIDLLDDLKLDRAGKSFGDATSPDHDDIDPKAPDFSQQNLRSYFISTNSELSILGDAAYYGAGMYRGPGGTQEVARSLQSAVRQHARKDASSAPISSESASQLNSTILYQANYFPGDWSGSLSAYRLANNQSSIFDYESVSVWDAGEQIPPYDSRHILSAALNKPPGTDSNILGPILFEWDQLGSEQQIALGNNPNLLGWIRGSTEFNTSNGGEFRLRKTILGDIVHSGPVLLPETPDINYPDSDYQNFIQQQGINRNGSVIFVGANDGMLHAFSGGSDGGTELFAYVPHTIFPKLAMLADPNYAHHYYVDGPSTLFDARIGDSLVKNPWRSVLATTLGAGGAGIFALNVTDHENFTLDSPAAREELFMWEISNTYPQNSDTSIPIYPDMGFILNQVSIIRVIDKNQQQKWFLITGNGVESQSGKAVLYIINLADGSLFQELVVSDTGHSGMTSATAIDIDEDSFVDRIYTGDLEGHIWRFDWDVKSSKFSSYYTSNNSPQPLFTAKRSNPDDTVGVVQPIVSGFEAGQLPGKGNTDGLMIYFGTGKYHDIGDNTDKARAIYDGKSPIQSIYGIWDSGRVSGFGRERLVLQNFFESDYFGSTVRNASSLMPTYQIENDLGWVIDLLAAGERIIQDPVLVHGRILITSLIPVGYGGEDPCNTGATGWVMELDATTGGNSGDLIFDVNDDGTVDFQDTTTDGNPLVGIESDSSAPSRPIVIELDHGGKKILTRISAGSDGEFQQFISPITVKRLSWRRLE